MSSRELPKVGPRYRYRNHEGVTLEFWAEEGLICVEDQSTGEYYCWNQDEARHHFRAIGKAFTKADIFAVSDTLFRGMRDDWRNLLLNIREVVRDAANQGDPAAGVEVYKKQLAEVRTELAAYNRNDYAVVHNDGVTGHHVTADPRARRLPNGALYLPHGGGRRHERKYF